MLKRSDFIVFYGNIGSGKTLGAVGYIKDCEFKNLVSNVTLNEIKYMPFHRHSFLRYKNKVVFLDMVDFYSDMTSQRNRNRREKLVAERMIKFFNNGNKLIITIIDPCFLYPAIQKMLTCQILTEVDLNNDKLKMTAIDGITSRQFVVEGISKYFNLYNTTELVNWNK